MLNLGAGEVILILVVALLVLGPKRLPELARGIGKFMREFRRQTDEVRSVVEREFYRMDQDVTSGLAEPEPQPQSILPVQAPRPPASLMEEASLPTNPGAPGPASASAAVSGPPPGTVKAASNGSPEGA
ncbi:MAG TPA: twin-arginine translocase TatA/TatE family subunit [Myxococcales bacterium]|nr:twin-arginine translocase TatA/TatE family subunit [Myxococcales bacterium]